MNMTNQADSQTRSVLRTANWPGHSGRVYKMFLNPIGATFKDEPGIYIFSKLIGPSWQAVYIGETQNLKSRLSTDLEKHVRIHCIRKHGATHMFALIVRADE